MRFLAFATAALAAFPFALARDFPKEFDHKDYNKQIDTAKQQLVEKLHGHQQGEVGHKHDHHKHEHEHEHKHKHKHIKPKDLTVKFVCEKLNHLADNADSLYNYVKSIKCGKSGRACWEPVRNGLYELEWELDLFDTAIDVSNLNKCFTEKEEYKITCCYYRYADSLIKLLEELSKKLEHIEGETAYYIVTAVNSLRAADYTFVYELVRRFQFEKYQSEIFKKEGAADGSTPKSVRKAFALFVSTPYITGEDFKVKDASKEPKDKDLKIIEEIKHKSKHHKGHHHHHHPHHHHKDHEKTRIKIEEHVDHSQ